MVKILRLCWRLRQMWRLHRTCLRQNCGKGLHIFMLCVSLLNFFFYIEKVTYEMTFPLEFKIDLVLHTPHSKV